MQRRAGIVLAIGVALIVGLLAAGVTLYESEDTTSGNVVLYDGDERIATINASVADEFQEQYVGLGDHDDLADDEGMLFVYEHPANRTFVMRSMAFGIDIIYVDSEGCITSVNPAPEPGPDENGEDQEYPGYGQYVIEVPIGVASDAGVERGDPVRIEYGNTTVDGRGTDCFES
ncbi:hypothetical protein L593_00510 [Salinarchaeum sp. Harcht-Bsk1]|uniref:DUF192 domain-containing protein n=1 Tax=Salinarchaeum sp. Harcht-Bsk1 TaxID=1333523 RepID=UPI0003422E6E|nr:DUF192 domain-containing protein [Salinarchaeum sp. Harcht-Bsk1]AGN00057.1 hypothetical protein L593_00510 [Salinarchaeum sp. Harcht-Bsk1]